MKVYNGTIIRELERCHHDIQEPIRNISNFLELIKIQISSVGLDNLDSYIDFALDSIRVLDGLNRDILTNRRGGTSRIDLRNILDDIRKLLRTQLERANCRIIMDDRIPDISGRHHDILRILKNLIENSMKYSQKDKLTVSISLISNGNGNVSIMFSDDGLPPSLETKKLIEGLLLNGKGSEKLGVVICRELMEYNDGTISLMRQENNLSYNLTFREAPRLDNVPIIP